MEYFPNFFPPNLPPTNFAITELNHHRERLSEVLFNLQGLMTQYHARKSLLGQVAYWYGELQWWMRILVSVAVTGIATLLFVPVIISIALSFAISFFLMNHYNLSKERDHLIAEDLQAQAVSVRQLIDLLHKTCDNLEQGLTLLTKINQDMGQENECLQEKLLALSQQVNEYESLNTHLKATIETLELNQNMLAANLNSLTDELDQYKVIAGKGSASLGESALSMHQVTESLKANAERLGQLLAVAESSPLKKNVNL